MNSIFSSFFLQLFFFSFSFSFCLNEQFSVLQTRPHLASMAGDARDIFIIIIVVAGVVVVVVVDFNWVLSRHKLFF